MLEHNLLGSSLSRLAVAGHKFVRATGPARIYDHYQARDGSNTAWEALITYPRQAHIRCEISELKFLRILPS
jgi:hypothetical protein